MLRPQEMLAKTLTDHAIFISRKNVFGGRETWFLFGWKELFWWNWFVLWKLVVSSCNAFAFSNAFADGKYFFSKKIDFPHSESYNQEDI